MKVIDLLNKIANGEEIPEVIWIKGRKFEKYLNHNTYIDEEDEYFLDMTRKYTDDKDFYNEEIIEEIIEEPKKIEKLIFEEDSMKYRYQTTQIRTDLNVLAKKLNEIIDYINKDKE